MLIGHLPAAWLFTRAYQRHVDGNAPLWIGLVGGVVPDADLFYFYSADHRHTLHHHYWTHLPAFWLLVGGVIGVALWVSRRHRALSATALVLMNALLHLLLDTPVGKIRWLYPMSDRDFFLWDVPRRYPWYVLNFVLHPSFFLELLIVGLFVRQYLTRKSPELVTLSELR